MTVTNKGAETATDIVITFDLSQLDSSVVDLPAPAPSPICEQSGKKITCGVEDLKPGENADLEFELVRKGAGVAGKLTASVSHSADDPTAGDNSATAVVTVSEDSGPDLTVFVPDVPINDEGQAGTVAPGEQTELVYAVGNFGDEAVAGLKLTIQLPEHVTFVEKEEGCAPAVLDGGVVSAEGLKVEEQPEVAARKASTLPAGIEGKSAKDIDESDNSDEFSVHVAAAGGGGGGGGGELPVTGVPAGLIGGVGLAVVGGGLAMLLVSRRRRIVVAVPDDEKPTA